MIWAGIRGSRGRGARVLSAKALVSMPVPGGRWRLSPSPKPERAARAVRTTAFMFSALDGSLSGCHGLSRLAATGGRLLQPGDAEAEPLEAGGIHRAIAFSAASAPDLRAGAIVSP